MNSTKICSKCGRELPLEYFSKCKKTTDGLQYCCKECNKQYRAEHAEKMKQYKAEHKEELKQYMAKWNAEYYAEHKEEKNQYYAERYATLEGYAYSIRHRNLQADREHGRIGKDEDPLPPLEYYIWALQQRDFYDGKQYHWSEMGLDRIYNDKPHTFANVVPCSTNNNRRRRRMPFEEFCKFMDKI